MSTNPLPEIAKIVAGLGDLPKIEIKSSVASADIYLHGAHVTSWQPRGSEEVIFLSGDSYFEAGRAIRGGVPICFPWFGKKADDPKAAQHGFARTSEWTLDEVKEESGSTIVSLSLASSEVTKRWWPYEFRAVHRITIGAELKLELIVTNTGGETFTFEEALHTYHRIGDATQVRITGLDLVDYLDNHESFRRKTQHGDIFMKEPIDNIYIDTSHATEIHDPVLHRRLLIDKLNSLTTVVWNPGQDGAKALSDMADNEWQTMACIEASNVRDFAVTLKAGESHMMTAIIRVNKEG